MKILCIFPFKRKGLLYSGGEKRFIEIISRWIRKGNEIHVITTQNGNVLLKKLNLKVKTILYRPVVAPAGLGDFLTLYQIMRHVSGTDYDFIYCSGELFLNTAIAFFLRRKLKVPVVAGVNLLDENEWRIFSTLKTVFMPSNQLGSQMRITPYFRSIPRRVLNFLKILLRNTFIRKFDLIFSVTNHVRSRLVEMGIEPERVYPVKGGIDHALIKAVNIDNREKEYDGCFLGAIHPRKGIFDLILAWRMVVQKIPSAKLIIIGTGPRTYIDRLKDLIQRWNLKRNIMLTGFIDGPKKYELLKKSKIFLFPSYNETFAQAICEAMACGLPVIAYDLPSYREVYGENIFYVRKGDINEFIKMIIRLLLNENLRNRVTKKSDKIAEQYNWDDVANCEMEIICSKLNIKNRTSEE
ncbi:MAG: glycosyltransferase family 4 protein [Candidatus Njordarchaeales archaeon]